MKTKEQIDIALGLIDELKDYVELAKVEKKLSVKENADAVADQIEVINETMFAEIKEL